MFLLLIQLVIASRILTPNTTVYQEQIPTNHYNRSIKESMDLDYYAYPGVFAIELHKRVNGNITKDQINLNDFEKVEEQLDQESGCFSVQRSLEVNFQLKIELESLDKEPAFYFTDVATCENQTRVYIVRNDFSIYEIDLSKGLMQIDLNRKSRSFADLLDFDKDEEEIHHPYLVDDEGQNRIYAITQKGGVSFSTLTPLLQTEFRLEEFKERKNIQNVHYNARLQVIIVALGMDGVDIYDIVDGVIVHKIQLQAQNFNQKSINIIDVDSNEDQTILYLLDKEIGLLFYDIQDFNKMFLIMKIEISNCRHFDHFANTFFIVARANNQQDYAVEIFVDLNLKNYFFNTFYNDELSINDVNVFEHYAIIIGEDGHKIVYHSIYNDFLDSYLTSHTYFQEQDLVKIKEYDFSQKPFSLYRLIVGIAKQQFKYLEIKMEMPTITCELPDPKEEDYFVLLNSTQCQTKSKANDDSPFSYCNITHNFQYLAFQKPGNYQYYTKLTLTVYVLFVVLVWTIVIGYALYKKWGHRLSFLSWRRKRAAAAAPYNESFDVKEQEMSNDVQQQQNAQV